MIKWIIYVPLMNLIDYIYGFFYPEFRDVYYSTQIICMHYMEEQSKRSRNENRRRN